MRRLIKKFPDVAAIVFDRCITYVKTSSYHNVIEGIKT